MNSTVGKSNEVGKHGEPWRVERYSEGAPPSNYNCGTGEPPEYGVLNADGEIVLDSLDSRTADHIVECVNALAGKNPAAVWKVVGLAGAVLDHTNRFGGISYDSAEGKTLLRRFSDALAELNKEVHNDSAS